MMKIILAVVVSLVVWFLTFDLFFGYTSPFPSLAVALAAGIITWLILRTFPKPGLALQLVIVGLVAGLALFAVSKLLPRDHDEECSLPPNRPITVTCSPVDATPDICASEGEDVVWDTSGVATGITIEIHKFKRIINNWPDPKESPLVSDPGQGNNQNNLTGKVKTFTKKKKRKYKYTVTCTPGGDKDPMIEVPKGR